MLEIKNVTKQFKTQKVLDNVSLTVKEGEIALLIGPSGVGKSTLLRILNNLEPFDSGTITLDNKPLDTTMAHKEHLVGMVFQHFNLFKNMSVRTNITFVLQKSAGLDDAKARKEADKLLEQFGLLPLADVSITDLSGGQKQRLALARTLSLKPRVICLDEPTSALDPLLTGQVSRIIENLAKQKFIVLIATHDTTLLKQVTGTMHLMQAGTISESATSGESEAHPEKYPKLQAFIAGQRLE